MTRTRLLIGGLLLVVLVGAGLAVRGLAGSTSAVLGEGGPGVPLGLVERGSLQLDSHMTGQLRPVRQASLTVPSIGGVVRILDLRDTGTRVEAGDLVATFDPSDQEYALEQAESQLREAEQQIIKRRADIEAQKAQDAVTLMTAEFDVRRAELDARADAELIGANEYRIRQVTLEESRRRLEQVRQDIEASSITTEASLQVLEERLTRQRLAADEARRNMDNLTLTAPTSGIVSVRENRDGTTFFYSGMTLPPYRIGDDARSGRPIVDVLDVSTMEIIAKVNEQERGNVRVGQTAVVTCDAVPGATYEATVTSVSGLAARQDYSFGPLRVFDVTLEIREPDDRLRPGASVEILVNGDVVDDVLLVPRQALFEADGKPIVYVPSTETPGAFEPRPVTVLHRSETMVALDGLDEGMEIALVDPASVRAPVAGGSTPLAGPGGMRP